MKKYQKQKIDVALWIMVLALVVLVIAVIIKTIFN